MIPKFCDKDEFAKRQEDERTWATDNRIRLEKRFPRETGRRIYKIVKAYRAGNVQLAEQRWHEARAVDLLLPEYNDLTTNHPLWEIDEDFERNIDQGLDEESVPLTVGGLRVIFDEEAHDAFFTFCSTNNIVFERKGQFHKAVTEFISAYYYRGGTLNLLLKKDEEQQQPAAAQQAAPGRRRQHLQEPPLQQQHRPPLPMMAQPRYHSQQPAAAAQQAALNPGLIHMQQQQQQHSMQQSFPMHPRPSAPPQQPHPQQHPHWPPRQLHSQQQPQPFSTARLQPQQQPAAAQQAALDPTVPQQQPTVPTQQPRPQQYPTAPPQQPHPQQYPYWSAHPQQQQPPHHHQQQPLYGQHNHQFASFNSGGYGNSPAPGNRWNSASHQQPPPPQSGGHYHQRGMGTPSAVSHSGETSHHSHAAATPAPPTPRGPPSPMQTPAGGFPNLQSLYHHTPYQTHGRRSRSASRRLRDSPPPSSGRSRSSPPFTAQEYQLQREANRLELARLMAEAAGMGSLLPDTEEQK